MAEIDPRITALLAPLFRSRLEQLARIAVARIEGAETDIVPPEDDEKDPLAAIVSEQENDRARRQLKIADLVVGGILRRERELMDRSIELVKQLNVHIPGPEGRRGEGLATIMLVDDPTLEGEAGQSVASGKNLLTGARRERMNALLDAWDRAVGRIREGIGVDGDR